MTEHDTIHVFFHNTWMRRPQMGAACVAQRKRAALDGEAGANANDSKRRTLTTLTQEKDSRRRALKVSLVSVVGGRSVRLAWRSEGGGFQAAAGCSWV